MNFYQDILNKLKSHVFYILITIYLIQTIVFTYERMLNTDCSLQLFNIVNSKNFFFQENRFGVWLSQIPLLTAVYFKIPLKFLIYIYSVSFPLFYLLTIWINDRIFKSKEAALATILSLILGVAFTFFHSITETHQLLAVSCLLFGLLQAKEKLSSYWFHIMFYLLVVWCMFIHPNAIFTVFFVVGISFLQRKINNFETILALFISFLFIIIKLYLTSKNSYDARQYDALLNFKQNLPHFFSLYAFRYLITKYTSTYLAGFLIILIVWLRYKGLKELLFTSFCFVGFTLLTILTFAAGDCDAIMEKSYMPGFFMFIILFSQLYYQKKSNYFLITLILAFFSFYQISQASKPYTKRLNLLIKIVKENPDKPKLIASFSDFDENVSRFNNWATSMDVLILTTCKNSSSKTILMVDYKQNYAKDTTNSKVFLYLPWNPYEIDKLNKNYFKLPEVHYKLYQEE
ncbi:MAG: hypothetical protein HXX18_03260 [Bacteroidetes bacterium]|nr:hypothetical protein [Bacteroidota bacterium]